MPLRAMWVSPAIWTATGYGVQTRLTVPRLAEMPEIDYIGIAAHTGLSYGGVNSLGIDHYPLWGLQQSDDVLRRHMAMAGCDTVITLTDLWALSRDFGLPNSRGEGYNWIPYCPIDSYPLSLENAMQLQKAPVTVTNSNFGKLVCEDAGIDNVHYIPHMVDTKLFRPLPDKRRLRKKWGFPEDSFLVGMVAANKGSIPLPRKGFQFAMEAFAEFRKNVPKAFLYMHTSLQPGSPEDCDLVRMANLYELDSTCIRGLDRYTSTMGLPPETLVEIYNCFDIVLSASLAESVNVPLLEAQACGIPIVATATTGQTEHVGSGWMVKGLTTILTPQAANWVIPNTPQLAQALLVAHDTLQDREDRKKFKKQARKFAEDFDADLVANKFWQPFLAEIAGEQVQELEPVIKEVEEPTLEIVSA